MSNNNETNNNITPLNQETFAEFIAEGITLVKFGAEWCGPCKLVSPILARMSLNELYSEVRFGEVDTSESPDLTNSLGIRGIPTIYVFNNGQITAHTSGFKDEAALSALLDLNTD